MNSKSSTKAEVIGISDYVPYSVWMGHFLEAQGYKLKHNIMYQDNQSVMLLEKGRTSCTGNSRDVNVQYFWIKDRVDKKELTIEYCPT